MLISPNNRNWNRYRYRNPPNVSTANLRSRLSRAPWRMLLLFACLAIRAAAQGPHEIALIVNAGDPDSLEIAHRYARLRGVPSANIIYLELPRGLGGIRSEIAPDQFQRLIYEPVAAQIAERRIQDHILAWMYSAGFPVRVLTKPPVSICGATFVRCAYPLSDAIAQGLYASPFFRGPDKPGQAGLPSASLQEFAVALKDQMPIPSMMLGYTANRGLTVAEVVEGHRRSAAADGTLPRDPFYFHTSDDIRSKARRWQFDGAVEELKSLGAATRISSNRPPDSLALSGLMLGLAQTEESWGRFQPGSLVDNFTSFGAEFHHHDQVRLSHWLRLGAAAAAGTVTEPYANWAKFPHARLFAHYARGCTALESYLQAIRSPLQQLIIGDPLAQPWGRPIPLSLIGMEDNRRPLRGEVSFIASSLAATPGLRYLYLLDGRYLPTDGAQPGIRFDSRAIADGWHELHAVAYSPGPVRRQGHARLGFIVDNAGRSAQLTLDAQSNRLDYALPFHVRISAAGDATGLAIVVHERTLWRGPAREQTVELRPATIGPGPVPLHAVATYPDGMQVRSPPLYIEIMRSPKPQPIDPDALDLMSKAPAAVSVESDGWSLSQTGSALIVHLPAPSDASVQSIAFRMRTRHERRDTGPLVGGIAWNVRDDKNFSYFGWHWLWGGWVLGRVRDGAYEPLHARGVPLPPRGNEQIVIRREGDLIIVWVDGEELARENRLPLQGPFGLIGGPIPWTLTQLRAATLAPTTAPE